jgi:hypothetical protein
LDRKGRHLIVALVISFRRIGGLSVGRSGPFIFGNHSSCLIAPSMTSLWEIIFKDHFKQKFIPAETSDFVV